MSKHKSSARVKNEKKMSEIWNRQWPQKPPIRNLDDLKTFLQQETIPHLQNINEHSSENEEQLMGVGANINCCSNEIDSCTSGIKKRYTILKHRKMLSMGIISVQFLVMAIIVLAVWIHILTGGRNGFQVNE